jgi:D-sedoheptulose 7-phosphate isomerase
MKAWASFVADLARQMNAMEITDADGRPVEAEAGFVTWRKMAEEVRAHNGTIFFAGNGASASMASHFAADVRKNGRIHTEVFHDIALMTAIANDIAYEQVFAAPLKWHKRPHSQVVLISSSGASPNVLAAAKVAREQDYQIVTLTGKQPDNPLRRLGELNFYLPAFTYGEVETGHAAILHNWMDRLDMQ